MADEKPKARPTRLRVTACTQVYQGKNERGDTFTIYEVEACKGDGSVVKEKLRSFENLPLEVLDLTVTPYPSEKHGLSYTLAQRNKPNNSQRIKDLEETVAELRSRVEQLEAKARGAADPDLQPTFGDIPV